MSNNKKLRPFHTYRGGNPPTPGVFATAASVYKNGVEVRVGDVIITRAVGTEGGIVVGIFDSMLIYLIDREDKHDEGGRVGDIFCCNANEATCVGHAYNPLAEVARIEAKCAQGQ